MSCLDATRDILKSEICPQKAILEEFRFLVTNLLTKSLTNLGTKKDKFI